MTRLTKNLVIALVVSVVLNVFFLGFSAARLLRRPSGHPESFQPEGESSGAMRGVWRREGAALRPRREAVEAARRGVRDALVAEPFNPEALEAALAALRKETGDTQVALHHALVEAARELGPEDRRKLAASRGFLGFGPHSR